MKKSEINDVDRNSFAASEGGVRTNERVIQCLKRAVGYCELGMFGEAEEELAASHGTPARESGGAHFLALQIRTAQRRSEDVVKAGLALIAVGRATLDVVINTTCALTFQGRYEEGKATLALVEGFGRPLKAHAYQMACLESRLRNYPEALGWMEIEAQRPRHLEPRSIGDSDLLPLWTWLGKGQIDLNSAHKILRLPLAQLTDAALRPDAQIVMDENDFCGLDEQEKGLFRYNFEVGIFHFNYAAAARSPSLATRFCKRRGRHIRQIADTLTAARDRALRMVLAAQPQYAGEHALAGNALGVRWHLTWALAHDPRLLADFRAKPELRRFKTLIDSMADAQREDPEFCARMNRIAEISASDRDEARRLLRLTPHQLRNHPLYRQMYALVLQAEGDFEGALALYLPLQREWPSDAAPLSNAVCCLIKMGRWEDAAQVFAAAPGCFRKFHHYQLLEKSLAERRDQQNWPLFCEFQGEPDLAGRLRSMTSGEAGPR